MAIKNKLSNAYWTLKGFLFLIKIITLFIVGCPIYRVYRWMINYERTIKSNEVKYFYKDSRDIFK